MFALTRHTAFDADHHAALDVSTMAITTHDGRNTAISGDQIDLLAVSSNSSSFHWRQYHALHSAS